ncbi:MAG: hypothetical protein RL757_658, partial [Bacteroidota bacterium]
MELNIKLSEADYLEYLLFSASKSDRIKKQTTRNILIVTFAFLGL